MQPQPNPNFAVLIASFGVALLLYLASINYAMHKIFSIWLFFAAAVLALFAICLYWQKEATTELENPPFAVAIETSYAGRQRDMTQIGCEYNQRFLSPVPISLFIRINNLQDIRSDISEVKVEVELTKRSWVFPGTWLRTLRIPEEMPLVWMNTSTIPARRLTLLGGYLASVLESKPLEPHQTVRGWVLLDVTNQFDSAVFPRTYRISVRDTAGRKLTVLDSGPTGEENVVPPRGFQITDVIDVTGFEVRHLADGATQ